MFSLFLMGFDTKIPKSCDNTLEAPVHYTALDASVTISKVLYKPKLLIIRS
jgi:hypothetical protein